MAGSQRKMLGNVSMLGKTGEKKNKQANIRCKRIHPCDLRDNTCSVQTKQELFGSHTDRLIHLACKCGVAVITQAGTGLTILYIQIRAGKDKKDYAC